MFLEFNYIEVPDSRGHTIQANKVESTRMVGGRMLRGLMIGCNPNFDELSIFQLSLLSHTMPSTLILEYQESDFFFNYSRNGFIA